MRKSILLFVPLIVLMGCSTSAPKVTPGIESYKLEELTNSYKLKTDELQDHNNQVKSSMVIIDDAAQDIYETTEEPNTKTKASIIREHVLVVDGETNLANEIIKDLKDENDKLKQTVSSVESLESEVESLRQRDKEVRAESLKYFYQYTTLFFVIGFATIVSGAFVTLFHNRKLGSVLLATGVITVGFAAASQYYLKEIAFVGLVVLVLGFLVTMGLMGYIILGGKKKEVANEEIVELIEIMKGYLPPEKKEEIFGEGGIADSYTSKSTRLIVESIRTRKNFKTQQEDAEPDNSQ